MSVKDQSSEISTEFFEIMRMLKRAELRMKKLHRTGEQFRQELGAVPGLGNAALVELDIATTHTTQALDGMLATCAAAKPDAATAGTPFECPSRALHRPSDTIREDRKAA